MDIRKRKDLTICSTVCGDQLKREIDQTKRILMQAEMKPETRRLLLRSFTDVEMLAEAIADINNELQRRI